MSNIDAMASDLFATISAYIDKRVATVIERMTEMQTKLDAYAKEDAERHEAALEEIATTDAGLSLVRESVAEIKAIPPAKDGQAGTDGKDAEVDYSKVDRYVETHVNSAMALALSSIPRPKDGENGINGTNGTNGTNGRDGVDGTSMSEKEARTMMEAIIGSALASIPAAKDGEDGRDGRDSIQCDVLDIVDPERRYQRGTYAKYRGGRIRAFRATDPMGDGPLEKSGWTVDLEGVAQVGVTQGDDMRSFAIGVELTSGKSFVQKFSMPVVLDRGKFEREQSYAKGDSVSWDGSAWIAQKDIESAADKPLPPDWRLSIKRGQDGKDLRTEEAPRPREPLRLR